MTHHVTAAAAAAAAAAVSRPSVRGMPSWLEGIT